jgi:polyphosphate glucokinase
MPNSHETLTIKKILSVDIGGSSVKTCLLSADGEVLSEYTKLPTPEDSSPEALLEIIKRLAAPIGDFDVLSVGFPGYVKFGVVETAPNLAKKKWNSVNFSQDISNAFKKPVRLVNDADQQGLGVVKGEGFEIVLTLGTGFGTALFYDGLLLPHLELAHFPVSKDKDYDDYIGDRAFNKIGKKDWNERVQRIIEIYKTVFNYDKLYIGGGNAKEIDFQLEDNIKIVNNRVGIKGGAKLWKLKDQYQLRTTYPTEQ